MKGVRLRAASQHESRSFSVRRSDRATRTGWHIASFPLFRRRRRVCMYFLFFESGTGAFRATVSITKELTQSLEWMNRARLPSLLFSSRLLVWTFRVINNIDRVVC